MEYDNVNLLMFINLVTLPDPVWEDYDHWPEKAQRTIGFQINSTKKGIKMGLPEISNFQFPTTILMFVLLLMSCDRAKDRPMYPRNKRISIL